jgi:hypothetical protein
VSGAGAAGVGSVRTAGTSRPRGRGEAAEFGADTRGPSAVTDPVTATSSPAASPSHARRLAALLGTVVTAVASSSVTRVGTSGAGQCGAHAPAG